MPTGWTPAAASSTLEEWTRTFSRVQQCSCFRTRNTFCRTRSLSNTTFSFFDHVIKIWWFYTEIWRYIDFQNGGRPPSWNCFTTIPPYETTHEVPVKFHVNLIHRSEDIAVWIFRIFGLKCLCNSPYCSFGGIWTPNCDYSSSRPPKSTSLRKSASFKLSTAKICWGVWPVGELTESVMDTHTYTHTGKFILCPCTALDRQIRG